MLAGSSSSTLGIAWHDGAALQVASARADTRAERLQGARLQRLAAAEAHAIEALPRSSEAVRCAVGELFSKSGSAAFGPLDRLRLLLAPVDTDTGTPRGKGIASGADAAAGVLYACVSRVASCFETQRASLESAHQPVSSATGSAAQLGHEQCMAAALDAGIARALARHLHPSLSAPAAAGALKAAWLACNIAGTSAPAAEAVLVLAPLLIAHLGGAYGPELVLQCAWALGNVAAGGGAPAVVTLLAQGAVPALLAAVDAGARAAAGDPVAADEGAVCAWALGSMVQADARASPTGGGEAQSMCQNHDTPARAANALLSARPPCSHALQAALSQRSHSELAIEAAWLAAHVAAAGTPAAQQLCGAAAWPALHVVLFEALDPLDGSVEPHVNDTELTQAASATSSRAGAQASWSCHEAQQMLEPLLLAAGNLLPRMSEVQAQSACAAAGAALPRALAAALCAWPHEAISTPQEHPPCGAPEALIWWVLASLSCTAAGAGAPGHLLHRM
jgi:hypothetical protein